MSSADNKAADSSNLGIVIIFKGDILDFEHNKLVLTTRSSSVRTYTQATYADKLAS